MGVSLLIFLIYLPADLGVILLVRPFTRILWKCFILGTVGRIYKEGFILRLGAAYIVVRKNIFLDLAVIEFLNVCAEEFVDIVLAAIDCELFDLVYYTEEDFGVAEEGELHGLFQEASFAFVESDLDKGTVTCLILEFSIFSILILFLPIVN